MDKRKGKPKFKKERPEFDQNILDLARVTRVTKGGKQLSFRACVVIGNRNGRVGYGIKKGKDVQIAVDKAVAQAKKNIITVPLVNQTVPHRVQTKYKAGRVMIKPAPIGSGIIAGSAVRVVLELAGVPNASAKMLSKTNNKITNLKAVFKALEMFKPVRQRFIKPVVQKKEEVVTEVQKEEVKKPIAKKPVKNEKGAKKETKPETKK